MSVVTPHARDLLVHGLPRGNSLLAQTCAGPGAAEPWPPTPRCRARRRSPRGGGRRRRAAPRPPAAGAAARARAASSRLAGGRGVGRAPAGSDSGRVSITGASRRAARRGGAGPTPEVRGRAVGSDAVQPGGELRVAAELAQPSEGPQVRLLHHVARVLLVAGQPVGERVRVRVRRLAPARRRPIGCRRWASGNRAWVDL